MELTKIRFDNRSYSFDLSATSIDKVSEWLDSSLQEAGADKSDRLRMRLLVEEALLNMADHFGEDHKGTAKLERRQGRHRLRLIVEGSRFNPLKPATENNDEDWSMSLFSVIDMNVQYAYSMGANVLRLSMPRPSRNPVLKIVNAILIGTTIGILGNLLIPNAFQEAFTDMVLYPISDMWVRLLELISSPVIFLTMLTAAFGTKRIANFGGSRLSTLAHYFAISAIVVLFTLVCCLLLFSLQITAAAVDGSMLSSALDEILQVIPDDLLEPFVEANTQQLLLIAIVTGYLLAAMESRTKELNVLIGQLYDFGLTVAQYACQFVPFFVGLLLCLKIWTHDIALLKAIWIPLVISTAISILVLAVTIILTSANLHMSPLVLAGKLRGPFVDALKRGTLDFSAINDLANSCKRLLGIDAEFARAVLPQGLFLYMPTSGIGICVFVMFVAHMQQMPINQMWLISAAVLSVIMAVATPPMTGANLLSFIMVFSYLGIPDEALLAVMVFDIVFGVLCIAFDQAMLQIETISQAERMSFLNIETLRAPISALRAER